LFVFAVRTPFSKNYNFFSVLKKQKQKYYLDERVNHSTKETVDLGNKKTCKFCFGEKDV
jgi:hypothetical protein